jgi:peptidyl-prolyl cis-trans isomerase SDCCAG10
MSSVYATEPATSGRVIFETSRGPIEIQLWCRECPQTTRIFLQLCLDGFFDGMIFHRIIPNFLIQTGAIRHPETPSSSISMDAYRSLIQADQALERRKYEVHSRLRFNHRGLVAMALTVSNEDDDDEAVIQPQFFITLDESSNLDGKHVIFGRIDAPTIFNAIKIGETHVDEETNQPMGDLAYAPRVRSVKIVDNPIHASIVPHLKVPWRAEKEAPKTQKNKRKGKRDINVLSFGDEVEDDVVMDSSIKSIHDVIQSKLLSKTVDADVRDAVEEAASAVHGKSHDDGGTKSSTAETTIRTQAVPERHVHARKNNDLLAYEDAKNDDAMKDQPERAPQNGVEDIGRATMPTKSRKDAKQNTVGSAVEARRANYTKGRNKDKKQREDLTMEKLFAFKTKVRESVATKKTSKKDEKENSLASRMARRAAASLGCTEDDDDGSPAYYGQILESDGDEEDGEAWLRTQFKCRRHTDLLAKERKDDLGGDGRDMNDYTVIDERDTKRPHSNGRHSHKRHKDSRHDRHRGHDGRTSRDPQKL